MSPHAGTHCSAGIDASDTRFFRLDSSEQRASSRSIFLSRQILAKKPYVPAHYFAFHPQSLADACARSRSRNTLRHSKRRAPQGRQWRTKWRRGCAVRSAGDDAAAKRRPITARCRSRARAGTMSSWRAAWNSRSAPNEATPSWIRALDIVSETALCWSSFDCTPRGARSDRQLLPLEIKRRHLLRKAQLATGHL